jgi:hypothetical protein
MPAPQASMMKQLARLQFSSFGIKVPDQAPQMNVPKTFADAFKDDEKSASPDPTVPPLFIADSTNKYHCDVQKQKTKDYGGYIDGICDAICSAWSQWQSAATLVGVMVNAVTASGGQVVGPPLQPLILATAPKAGPSQLKYSNVISQVIGTAWLQYQSSIKVPGLPWYPAFAAMALPVAPPMPNIPVPVAALTQVTVPVSKDVLKGQMIAQFADPGAPHHKELFDCIADAFEKCFQIWQTSTMVTNVLGTGPVPTFAPPIVPAGPVVGGVANMPPGGFA